MPRYTEKSGKVYDMGVEVSESEIKRMQKEYPEKMKKNEETAKNFPPAKKVSEFANKNLKSDLSEASVALSASQARAKKK